MADVIAALAIRIGVLPSQLMNESPHMLNRMIDIISREADQHG